MQSTTENEARKLGKYALVELVGRGAMGEVYKAQDPLIGRLVALKTITGLLANNPEALERFYQEARSAGTLQHPNIVTVYELGKEGETPFIAMEFLEGESLEKVIERRRPMELSHKLSHIVPVCRALNFAHKRGVIHRDIKPANVMVTKDGRVKVVDFGIARLLDSAMTQSDAMIGTIAYMSPQQIRGEKADERSDIWATGAMLYELLTYRRPFDAANHMALMMDIANESVMPPSIKNFMADCSPALEALVMKMLEKNYHQRYRCMDEVLHDIEPIVRRLEQRRTAPRTTVPQGSLGHTSASAARTVAAGASSPAAIPAEASRGQIWQAKPSAAAASNGSLLEKFAKFKLPMAIGVALIVLLVALNVIVESHVSGPESSAGRPSLADSSGTAAPPAAEGPPASSDRSLPVAPGVVATTAELARPWSSKEFAFRNEITGDSIPAMVVHLPRGGYWGFSLVEPYGQCRLDYVTDLRELADTYHYRADHPLIADTCNGTLFDLLRYGGPANAEVRGDIVRGSAVRPPLAIEIEERGNSVVAVRMEQ